MRVILIFFGLIGLVMAAQALWPAPIGDFREKIVAVDGVVPAPATEIGLADGGTTSLDAYMGEVAVVTIWATWCPICQEEMPELQALAGRFAGRPVAILPVSIDDEPAEAKVAAWLKTRGYDNLPVMIDRDLALSQQIGMRGTPTTIIVDKFGQIVAAAEGRAHWTDPAADAYLEALIAAETPEASRAVLTAMKDG